MPLVVGWLGAVPAAPPQDPSASAGSGPRARSSRSLAVKERDEPNRIERLRSRELRRLRGLLEARGLRPEAREDLAARIEALSVKGTDRVLVILVEFAGTDTITWRPGDTWDPLGRADPGEWTGSAGDCSRIIDEERTFTYSGPLHNRIPRPLSAAHVTGNAIWDDDFRPEWYEDLLFGDGVVHSYQRADGSQLHQDGRGRSVRDYFEDMSGGTYSVTGDVFGWLGVPHSVWWYGADPCPGRRSHLEGVTSSGAIPGAGDARTLVIDALEALRAAEPDLDWSRYDLDGDGVIDRLWIVHAGYGEEASATELNATEYGEAALWSHASSVSPPHTVDGESGIAAGPYIMMPENGGIGIFAHEASHNLGAIDLYADEGDTSAGFWTVMADNWTGYPFGSVPGALDPMHLDWLGWLDPVVISEPETIHTVALGQASRFPSGPHARRAARIDLPDQEQTLAVRPLGHHAWWGGQDDLVNASMRLRLPIAVPESGATLSFDAAWDIEAGWDFLWIQASVDGVSWTTLTSDLTTCDHAPEWIGEGYGFPADLCAAGIGGLTGTSDAFPQWETLSFDLGAFAGQDLFLRFWYMTDWNTLGEGPFVDNVRIAAGETPLLDDGAEVEDDTWLLAESWSRNDGVQRYGHRYYLQWRNVTSTGGYDAALGDARWRYGPADSGLVVWYENERYRDNELSRYLNAAPSFGPKGRMLVVDAHPEPYRVAPSGETANLPSRGQMRDAPFSTLRGPSFVWSGISFAGRAAVPAFHDALGYYPGVEWVDLGFGPLWATRAWDASTVVPARGRYPVRGAGYPSSAPLRYDCSSDGVLTACHVFVGGIASQGGQGDPVENRVQHGWNVRVAHQRDEQAVVRIWNSEDRRMAPLADVNGSGRVDGFDLAVFADVFGSMHGEADYDVASDLDLDGTIDGGDLLILGDGFGDGPQ